MADKGRRLKDVKAAQIAKRRRAKRRRRIMFLITEIFILFALVVVGYGMIKYGKIDKNTFEKDSIIVNDGVKTDGYTTIVLFGGDSREGNLGAGTHADTMMVASVDNKTKEIKMVSVYRDMLARQEDGTIKKANNGYFKGGPEGAINMLNTNLDLDIMDYVAVDFTIVAEVVDRVGGIDVELTEAEAVELNNTLIECKQVTGKEADNVIAGTQHLNGVQALAYSRMRYNVGGDYARTDRQRFVVQEVLQKVKKNPLKINGMIDEIFPKVSTSFTMGEIMKLATGVLRYNIGETSGYPFEKTDGNVAGIGSVVIQLGHVENVEELHAFLYPKDEYTVSATVRDIAGQVEQVSGYTRAHYSAP